MRRPIALVLALLCLPPATAGVAGPDEDGGYAVDFAVSRERAGPAALVLVVERDDGEATTTREEPLGTHDLPAGASSWRVAFTPEGPGAYTLRLLADGTPAAPDERVGVREGAGGSSRVRFEVADEPTRLTLERDDVNADGKSKAPGEALLTRVRVSDPNGLGDIDGLRWRVERAGALVEEGPLGLPADPSRTEASIEHRFTRSPMAAGEHRLTIHALRGGVSVASVTRTFAIRESPPALEAPPPVAIATDGPRVVEVPLVLADRNGPGEGLLEARVFRGGARMEGHGVLARLGEGATMPLAEGAPLAPHNGSARTAYPLRIVVPENATWGSYRVSLLANGSNVGNIPFEVRHPPRLVAFTASAEGDGLRVRAEATGPGVLVVRFLAGERELARADVPMADTTDVLVDAPPRAEGLRWVATLRSRADGPPLDTHEGAWAPAAHAPPLVVSPGPTARAWEVASAWELAGGEASVALRRWDGEPVDGARARLARGRLLLDLPPGLESGRYDATLRVALPNGTTATGAWSLEAGPALRVAVGEPVVAGREARIPVENAGGAPIARLVVRASVEGALVSLEKDGRVVEATTRGGRHVFDVGLAVGEQASLVVRLPSGPLRAGAHEMEVRVVARAAG